MNNKLILVVVLCFIFKTNVLLSQAQGKFISIPTPGGNKTRFFVAGPEDATAGIIVVHDFFGVTQVTKETVERLASLGYRTIAVDLYDGKAADTNEEAEALMKAKDENETARILKTAIQYLSTKPRKLAAIGFSAGGIDAVSANLMAPDLFEGSVVIYGGGFDQVETSRLDLLQNPVLSITGSLDEWPLKSALNFLPTTKQGMFELFVYAGVDHGYAQPLFNNGRNYDAEATRVTFAVMETFLARCFEK